MSDEQPTPDTMPAQPASAASNPAPQTGNTAMPPAGPLAAPVPPNPSSARHEGVYSILSTVAILLIAPFIAIVLTAFVFQSYQVDGSSMQTTLYNNDRLIVWKLPRTWARLTKHAYIPKRGDIIIFTQPRLSDFGQDPEKQLIKRVIGLPGDHVVVRNNVVNVYNREHPNGFDPDVTLPYHRTAQDTNGDVDVTVGAGQVFVLGDNRGDSLDSRLFGMVDAQRIVGKLIVRVLPLNQMERF